MSDTIRPGEKGFSAFLTLLSGAMLGASIALYTAHPGTSGPAITPLLASGVLFVLSAIQFIRVVKAATPKAKLHQVLPVRAALAMGVTAVYCALMGAGVSFYIATPVFLFTLSMAIKGGGWKISGLTAVLCTAVAYAVFELAFHIPLP